MDGWCRRGIFESYAREGGQDGRQRTGRPVPEGAASKALTT